MTTRIPTNRNDTAENAVKSSP